MYARLTCCFKHRRDTKSDNMMYKMGPKNLILNAIHEHLDAQYAE